MTFTGHYINGRIVPDSPLALPEGAAVRCDVAVAQESTPPPPESDERSTTLRERLKNFLSHTIDDLPPDAALNHDYYLTHGLPKRDESR